MKRFFSLLLMVSIANFSTAQIYQPNWESLDNRPIPQWFKNAKFGIFIHWGVYSVPGWSSKGNYAEWYQQGLQGTDTARQKFHKAKFGDRTYYDLANDFKAELFNPDDWAKLFEQSGAKYIVLTSKHHDGFTLWPSKEADKSWGFKWNAVDVGPKRDLIADLFKAVRKTSVRAGMYYSLYEWFNPLWKKDRAKFVAEHTWPQMKDLINNYQPDVFWTDGDWDAPAETWKSQEFLAWLYNESPVKNKVEVNDRWGSGIRFKHAGIYTPEYQPDLDFEDHYWEESRGMGYSYGYNREEDAWDYNSTQSLILQLIDKVSRGGNFLLDIGPDEHGKIPPIMQERLLQIGEWLKIKAPYAFVVKIDNYGMFSPKPAIKVGYEKGAIKPVISFSVSGVETVRYTTDGSEPGLQSNLYAKPFGIQKTSIIKAKAYLSGALPSATLEEQVKTYEWKQAAEAAVRPGINYRYYQPEKKINMKTSFAREPLESGTATVISVAEKKRADKFAFEFKGYIDIAKDGIYTFYTQSDDGSKLFIDDEEVVDNDGDHGTVEKSGKAALRKGLHKIRITYFDSGGGNELKVLIQAESGKKEEIQASMLFH